MNEERKELEETHPMEQPENILAPAPLSEGMKVAKAVEDAHERAKDSKLHFGPAPAPSDDVCYPQKTLRIGADKAEDGHVLRGIRIPPDMSRLIHECCECGAEHDIELFREGETLSMRWVGARLVDGPLLHGRTVADAAVLDAAEWRNV